MKNVIFIAPPAAGKGTQSERLINLGYQHLSVGDMLREEIKKESKIGLEVKEIMAKGLLVSDEIAFNLLKNNLISLNTSFILDGFPRTIKQAMDLDNLLQELNIDNYEVIYLDISLEEAMKRALGRLTCSCGATYNLYDKNFAPKLENICDKCGRVLNKRSDDNEESFKVRFKTFLENTAPIKEFYQSKNKLHIVDATKDYDEITDNIKEILK